MGDGKGQAPREEERERISPVMELRVRLTFALNRETVDELADLEFAIATNPEAHP